VRPLIKIDKKEVQKVEPKMFEPIDMIQLGLDRRRNYRSHSKLNINHLQQYSSEKLVRNEDAFSKKSTIKIVLNKNF
jgi:hypothetical protein